MKTVNSFDLFDTILGKKDTNQSIIFIKCMELNKLENFVEIRINSEEKAKQMNPYYNLNNIYKFIQNHYKLSYSKLINYINIELSVEAENLYPIYYNINKLNQDSILIIETYFSSEQIKKFLSFHNIIDLPIYTSSELNLSKLDGSIYTRLKKDYKIILHTGSDYTNDYEIPRKQKIPSLHYNFNLNKNINKLQNKISSESKNYLKMLDNNCKNSDDTFVWNIQVYYNFPILLLFANILNDFCKEKDIQEIIFINRNCIYLKKIFDLVNDSSVTITELFISNKILENKKYLKMMLNKFNNTTKYLVIDLHHGSKRMLANFFKISYNIQPYFYFLFAKPDQENFIYSIYENNDNLSRLIELFNIPLIGPPIDYNNNNIVYDKLEFDTKIPQIYDDVFNLIKKTINNKIINDYNQNFLEEYLQNLNEIKLKIDESVEYLNIKLIYDLSDKYYLKQDYRLGVPPEEVIFQSILNPSLKIELRKSSVHKNHSSKKSSSKSRR